MTIFPGLLEAIEQMEFMLKRKLLYTGKVKVRPTEFTETEFYWQNNHDPVIVERLTDGICKFVVDRSKLEKIISHPLNSIGLRNKKVALLTLILAAVI